MASELASREEYAELVDAVSQVARAFKSYSGNRLKSLVYELFQEEVSDRALREVI